MTRSGYPRRRADVLLSFLFVTFVVPVSAAAYRFTLTAENAAILPVPFSLDVEGIPLKETQTPRMYRIDGDKKIPLASQLDVGRTARVWFIPDQTVRQGQRVQLELTLEETSPLSGALTAAVNEKAILLAYQNKPILSYYHAEHPVPQGVDSLFKRSGFIHPLFTPEGKVVNRIQPQDHYHHYGIWSPWTVTQIEGREVDFWNLGKGQGTVRFAGLLSTVAGPVYAGFQVHQEHVMFVGENKVEKVAMNEVWDIRASAVELDGRTVWLVDYTSTLNNALSSPIELSAYRYGGGLGFRATDDWNKDNVVVLTSEGKSRNEADGTRARWADIRGAGREKDGTAGVLFLSHSANREHPEPMRVWPDNATGNGLMFFEFCPIRHNDWVLEPNRNYVLRYRMLVYDGRITAELAETLWKNFAQPPLIKEQP